VCQKQKPIVNELEQEYQGRIDFIMIDVSTIDGSCEFQKHGFSGIPAMIYIDAQGNQVTTTDVLQEKEPLQQRLEGLLSR
jgi:thiol-disulfide isomerase/thioredoxin